VPSEIQKGSSRFTIHLRLEDVIALTFFLINLIVYLIFGGPGRKDRPIWEEVGLGVISVSILLFITLFRQALVPIKQAQNSGSGLKEFTLPYAMIIRDWFPFMFILAMYYSLWGDATHLLITRDRDAALIAIDQRLFGFQASVALQRIANPALTAWMKFAYDSHPFLSPLVALFVYLKRPRSNFREMMSGLMVISFFGFLLYLLVPAIGPLYTLKDQYYVDLGSMQFMDFVKIRRDVFPSLHVGISFLVWMYAYRNSRWLFAILAPVMLSLWFSTLYLRQHYLIDVVAGLVLAPHCYLLANWLFAHFGEEPISFSIPMEGKRSLP
jgi:membrane-associated phospholipid phosphatase